QQRTVSRAHSRRLFRRDTVSRAHQAIETIAAFSRINVAIGQNGHCLARIVSAGIEVRHVICLRIGRPKVVIATPEFQTEIAFNLPTGGYIGLKLIEAEETDWVVVGFAVGAKVSQQRVGERIASSYSVSTRVESKRAGINRPAVLILSISDIKEPRLNCVLAPNDRQVVARSDIRSRREQGSRRSIEGRCIIGACKAGDGGIRNAVPKATAG